MRRSLQGVALALVVFAVLASCSSDEDEAAVPGPVCITDEAGCTCQVGEGTSVACVAGSPTGICCASPKWPNEGTCTCSTTTCADDDVLTCRCGRGLGGPLALCGGALCCQRAAGDCYCIKKGTAAPPECAAGDTPAADCNPSSTRCPADLVAVAACAAR